MFSGPFEFWKQGNQQEKSPADVGQHSRVQNCSLLCLNSTQRTPSTGRGQHDPTEPEGNLGLFVLASVKGQQFQSLEFLDQHLLLKTLEWSKTDVPVILFVCFLSSQTAADVHLHWVWFCWRVLPNLPFRGRFLRPRHPLFAQKKITWKTLWRYLLVTYKDQ